MQKNYFGSNSNSNSNSETIDWRIDQASQTYVDGPNVFTTISDHLEGQTYTTIDSDKCVKPLVLKVLAMPLNYFLLASQIDKSE